MFKLQIADAERFLFPVERKSKKGQPVIDPETGETKTSWVPGAYRITFNDGQWCSVSTNKGVQKFSINAPGAMITDKVGNKLGQLPSKKVSPVMTWDQFVKEYTRCGMPDLVLQGMTMANERLAAEREARRAA